jgi:hypothetical protein
VGSTLYADRGPPFGLAASYGKSGQISAGPSSGSASAMAELFDRGLDLNGPSSVFHGALGGRMR